MKKIKYILFAFLMMMFIPFSVTADENKVYWEIGGEDKNLKTILENKGISEGLLYSVDSIIFNNYEKSNNKITDFDTEIDISKLQDNSVIAGIKDSKLYIQYSGTLYLNSDSSYVFFNMEQITSITGLEYVNTSSVTNMSYMFYNCILVEELNLGNFDTSNVTNMSHMFSDMDNLITLDLSNFNTSNVVDMSYMFNDMNSIETLNISSFNTSNVTNMSHMFNNTKNLTSLDVSNFNTSKVTNMSYMFYELSKLGTLNIKNFDTSNVTDMSYMFYFMISLTTLDVSGFNTSNVTNMSNMFYRLMRLTTLDVSGFDTSNVTDMSYMFGGMDYLKQLDVSNFDTSKVTNMQGMFLDNEIKELDVSNFDTSKVTNMAYMFAGMRNLSTLNVSGFDTTNVIDMSGMFKANAVRTLDVSSFNTSNVTNMSEMFCNMTNLLVLNLKKFDTLNVTNMYAMFAGISTLKSLNISSFNTSKVTNMKAMFEGLYGLRSLDVSSFDTSKVTDMSYMFNAMTSITSLDVSNFDLSSVRDMSSIFMQMYNLAELDISGWEISKDAFAWMFEDTKNIKKIITPKKIESYAGNGIPLNTTLYDENFQPYDYLMPSSNSIVLRAKYTISFDNDISSREILYDTKYGELPVIEKEDYIFLGWYKSEKFDELVTSETIFKDGKDVKLYAKLVKSKSKVTFVDEDGTTILKDAVEYDYGTKASDIAKPSEPSKKSTAQYTYIFAGWTPMIEDVTKDIVYKATYSSVLNTYTVTWLNEDGTVLEIDKNVEYGTMPKYGSETPKKDRTPQYTYVFDKWDKEISEVTGDVTYKAVFKKEVNKYKVTFVDEDGTTILKETREYDYGTISNDIVKPSNPSKKATAQYTYTFSGWTPTIENVTKDIVYKATYSSQVNRYKVHFVYQNDVGASIMETFEYDYGTKVSDIVKPDPTRKSNTEYTFTFTGWSPEIEDVTKDITYTATYSSMLNTYTVIWLNEDGTVLETDVVEYGIMPQYDGDIPEKAGVGKYVYVFDKWDKEVSRVTGDVTYTAVFKELNVSITSDVYDIGDNYVYVGKKHFTMSNISLVSEELDITGYKETGLVYIYYKGKLVKTYDLIIISSSYYEWGSEYIYLKTEDININSINIVNGDISVENNKLLVKYNDIVLDEFDLIQISSEIHNINVSLKYSNYMYLGINNLDLNDISIVNGNLIVEDNKLLVKYKDKIVDEYVLIKISSDKYDLSKKYILSTNELFDINKVNVINGYLELDDDVLKVYYDDVINGTTYKMSLSEYDIVNITSEMQDVTKPYLYFNRNYGSEQSVLKITNAKQYVSDDKLNIFYENELLFSYDIVSLSSTKYKIGRDYIYTKNINLDLNDITIRGVNVTLKKEENKLKVYYGEEIIKMFDMITLFSDLYNICFDDNISGYMYIGNKELDLSKINAISGKLKEQNNMLYVFYDDEQIDGLKIVSVSSDKYTILDEEYTDYIYVGEDYIDTDKILSGIKVINGTAKFNRNSNDLIHIVPDGFNSLSLGSLSIITAITDISLNVTEVNLSKNNLYQIVATINPWNTLDDKTLTWTSENESVAKVYSLSGDNSIVNVSAIGSGETIITVTTKNGKSASFKVIVSGFDIEVESNNIYVSYDGKEHQIIPNVKTSGAKISYSLDGIDYNLTESPKFIKPGRYKVYYKVEAQNYNDYYGDGEVRISGILSMPSNMIIKNKYLIINNYDNSLYRLMSGINLYALSDFFEYRYDGGLYQPGSDYSGSNQFLVSTGKSFWIYIDSVLSPMYSYTMVLRGDLSGDGDVDSLDLATMMNHISGKKELMGAHLEAAYLNNDEDIDSLDLAYLMNHIAGKEGY